MTTTTKPNRPKPAGTKPDTKPVAKSAAGTAPATKPVAQPTSAGGPSVVAPTKPAPVTLRALVTLIAGDRAASIDTKPIRRALRVAFCPVHGARVTASHTIRTPWTFVPGTVEYDTAHRLITAAVSGRTPVGTSPTKPATK